MLEIRGLFSGYGRITAVRDVSVGVRAGELVCLIGANGAGKTTLLRAISGILPISRGRITFDGKDVTRLPTQARVRAGIVQVPEGRQIFLPLTIEDNLRLGGFQRKDDLASDVQRVYDMFPVLAERRRHAAGGLSGGQQQMLAIGRALISRPKLLLLDEPSMGLAPLLVEQILASISRLREEQVTILLVEQNAGAALTIADRGYVMEGGTIVQSGRASELLKDPAVRESYLGT